MPKSIEQKYKKLSDVEHVLLRPGRYIGSIKPHTATTWVMDPKGKMTLKELTWNPGLCKLFDEVISNSVDHSKRPEGAHLDTIKVQIDRATGEISVEDNGGIPVAIHSDYQEYVPTLIFGYLRSGSNFDDTEDSTGTGQNGEGASLTNIFSTRFRVETSDGKKSFSQIWTKNMTERTNPAVSNQRGKHYTRITFTPDYAHLEATLDEGNLAKLEKRVWDIAGCNPNLKVYLNGVKIDVRSFKDYVALYVDEFEYEENAEWQVGISHSDDGFKHVSFVNTTETLQGGTHVQYVGYQVAEELRELIKKKHKVEVKPSEVLAHMRIFINATIVRPRYDSQTKENLITEQREFKTAWKPSEKFIQRIFKSKVIESLLLWVEAKARALELKELEKANKDLDKFSPRRIVKLQDAGLAGKDPSRCILFLTEGDSAAKVGQGTADRQTMGFLALRGKPLNVSGASSSEIVANVEFMNFMAAMGLKIGTPVRTIGDLRYGMIGIMTDADHDGAGHITGLLINNINRFWPELFKLGVVHRFITPIVRVRVKGKDKRLNFFTEHEYRAWRERNQATSYKSKYYKGLGTSEAQDFIEYFEAIDDHLIKLDVADKSDSDVIELVFGKGDGAADARKDWLALT